LEKNIISRNSTSFGRYKEFMVGIGDSVSSQLIKNNTKKDLLNYMHTFGYNKRAVYYAELLKSKKRDEILRILKRLKKYIEKEAKKRDIVFNGIIEAHPQGDFTSKSAHIHYWGDNPNLVSPIISEFIKNNYLTLSEKTNLDYTSMQSGKFYRVDNNKNIIYNITDKTIEKETTKITDSGLKESLRLI
jgi:hypothetical protein